VPGKKQNRREALRGIFAQLPAMAGGAIKITMASGEEVVTQVDDVCGNQLSRGTLVRRETDGRWTATDAASAWLNDQDDVKFAEYLHANIKLVGELLAQIESAHSKADLLSIAHEYGLLWTSTDQLYRRISWMEILGLLERWGSNKFVVTQDGRRFLERIELATAAEAVNTVADAIDDEVLLPPPGDIVTRLTAKTSHERKVIIGYIPRGKKAPDRDSSANSQLPFEAIRTLLSLVGDGVGVEEYYRRCFEQLGVKRTSAMQTMHTMRQMKVFDMVAYNQYGPNPDVVDLLELGNELDFIRYMHSRYNFIGELLTLLDDATPVPEIARIASERYGFNQIDNGEVRTRMGFLLDAGLVDRIDWTRYRVTTLGKLLTDELTLELPTELRVDAVGVEDATDQAVAGQLEVVLANLREYGRRADKSEEFEVAVAEAFNLLGFVAHHVGGAGQTDVVVDAELPEKDAYRVIVDAKASASGLISDNAVKFDALKDHQRKHRADFGVVVGPDFAGRVREWASSNKFTLLTIDDLENLLVRHARHPLALNELRVLFQQRDGDDLADIEEQYSASARTAILLAKIVELLYDEAKEEDPLLDGYISLENVNYALRKELSPRPTQAVVEECLQFLSHDFVRGAVRNGSKYKLADAPVNIKRRLAGLGLGMGEVGGK
jgi:hypothetical protein